MVLQGTSPIYNLLPDMLSSLSSEASLPPEHFQAIMRHLLTFIAKEKQVDSLVEKLCLRFAATQASKLQPLLLDRFGPVNVGLHHVIQHPHSQICNSWSYRDRHVLPSRTQANIQCSLWWISLCYFRHRSCATALLTSQQTQHSLASHKLFPNCSENIRARFPSCV